MIKKKNLFKFNTNIDLYTQKIINTSYKYKTAIINQLTQTRNVRIILEWYKEKEIKYKNNSQFWDFKKHKDKTEKFNKRFFYLKKAPEPIVPQEISTSKYFYRIIDNNSRLSLFIQRKRKSFFITTTKKTVPWKFKKIVNKKTNKKEQNPRTKRTFQWKKRNIVDNNENTRGVLLRVKPSLQNHLWVHRVRAEFIKYNKKQYKRYFRLTTTANKSVVTKKKQAKSLNKKNNIIKNLWKI